MRGMRAVRMLLVAFVIVAAVALVAPTAASAYVPATTYGWAQPGAVTLESSVWAQPPASIPAGLVPAVTNQTAAQLGATYHWVQLPAEIPAR
jgi:hypothetical protein